MGTHAAAASGRICTIGNIVEATFTLTDSASVCLLTLLLRSELTWNRVLRLGS